jgi:hypothetical protein
MMRLWLLHNRHGRMTSDQWLILVTEPLLPIILLIIPVLAVAAHPAGRLLWRAGGVARWLLPVLALAVLVMLLLRARRYAGMALQQAVFYGQNPAPFAQRWRRKTTLLNTLGHPFSFDNIATPSITLSPDAAYLVYYLEERSRRVLLSLAPLEHEDAEQWQPSEQFLQRQAKRLRRT